MFRFDDVESLLENAGPDPNGGRGADCPICGGHLWYLPYSDNEKAYGEFKCIAGTRNGWKACETRKVHAAIQSLIDRDNDLYELEHKAGKNSHDPPPEPPPRQAPIEIREPAPNRHKVEVFTDAELMAMEFQEIKWAVPGYLSEGLNVIAGSQKLGKSWLVGGTGIAISSGGMALGRIPVDQGDVLYLALEDTKRRLRERLGKMLKGAQPSGRLSFATEWPRMHEGGLDWIRKWLETHTEARLVIIDTLKKIRPPRGSNGSFYDEDYEIGTALKEVADEFGICMVVVTHVSKAQHEDIFNAVSGSMGVTASADATLILERPRGSNQGVLHVTGRDVEEKSGEDAMSIEFDGLTGTWTLKGTVGEVGMSDERREILEVLDRALNPMSPKDIAEKLGKKDGNIRFLVKKMHDAGEIRSVGSGKYLAPCANANTANGANAGERWWDS